MANEGFNTAFEDLFIGEMDFLSQYTTPMIHGSTLLNICRGVGVGVRKNLKTDKEINLYILAEEFNDALYRGLRERCLYFHEIRDKNNELLGVYYSPYGMGSSPQSHWEIDPGFVYLVKVWKGKTTNYKRHNNRDCVLIPNKFVRPIGEKAEWSNINILNRTYKGPAHLGEYLDYYYDTWWNEDRNWHWSRSPNHITYDELIKRGEVCLE